jgi:type II secretory pathway pseudopilin PulG
MCRKLIKLLKTVRTTIKKSGGFTLTEVVIASGLLIIVMVPILKALTTAQVTSTIIEQKTRSLTLAQAKLDEIKARSIYDYDQDFTENDTPLSGSYLGDVSETSVGSNSKKINVSVGFDQDGDSNLDNDEYEVTLVTLVARRW